MSRAAKRHILESKLDFVAGSRGPTAPPWRPSALDAAATANYCLSAARYAVALQILLLETVAI